MSTTHNSPDFTEIPIEYKALVTDRLVARLGTQAPSRQSIDLLWDMVESATWEYREAVNDQDVVSVADVCERAIRLTEQITSLGFDDRRISDIFDALASVGVCAGFFGIARDLTLIPGTAL